MGDIIDFTSMRDRFIELTDDATALAADLMDNLSVEDLTDMAIKHITDDIELPVDLTTRLLEAGIDVSNLKPLEASE